MSSVYPSNYRIQQRSDALRTEWLSLLKNGDIVIPERVLSMNREEALRAISEDQLDYIQKPVPVDFDASGRLPVSFTVNGRKHVIAKIGRAHV